MNQSSLNVSKEKVEALAVQSNELKQKEKELGQQYKISTDELKKLMGRKTVTELQMQIEVTSVKVEELQNKMNKLANVDAEKVDPFEVERIEKEETFLRKELNKRRKLVKECLKTWSQILEKKVPEVAELMGV